MSDSAPQADTGTAPAPDHPERTLPSWIVPAGFIVGCAFLLLTLAIVVLVKPDPGQQEQMMPAIRTIQALGGAAFSMSLSGFLSLRLNLPNKGYIVAGGTLAVFVILYFFAPTGKNVNVKGNGNITVVDSDGSVHVEPGARTAPASSSGSP
ncbi:hypothetical protein WME90_45315 [Sorangium sp. So ce375]|uniref:hypothetical protein n=1 Tax=Sorangium sp. So ce375 TaxID=3133306 RepID=UPI003F5BEE99